MDQTPGAVDQLAAFVIARLDEDEAGAREACDNDSGEWFMGDKWNVFRAEDESRHFPETGDGPDHQLVAWGNVKPQSEHIARHDPARALREVEAKRAILTAYQRSVRSLGEGLSVSNRRLVQAVAAVYSDHPDYDPAWASA